MPNAVEPPTESPTRLEAAYALLADRGGPPWRPLAGGTDLMVQVTGELGEPPERILDIWQLDELRGISVEDGALVIGAHLAFPGGAAEDERRAECQQDRQRVAGG